MLCYLFSSAAVLAFLAILYKFITCPGLRYHSLPYRVKACIVFWLGDIRRLDAFPWVTWASHDHKIDLSDARKAMAASRPGDIGIHRDSGYLSNLGIPGAFKHAWVCVEHGMCVEAMSEGVLKRDQLYPLVSDYAIILRPLRVGARATKQAINRANSLVGCEYDANFSFDFEKDDAEYKKHSINLSSGGFHGAFSCTEVAAWSWHHCKNKLGIFRSIHAGREAVIADDFLRMNFGIIWMAPSVTVEWATQQGLHEAGRQKIADFQAGNKDFDANGEQIKR